MSHSSMYFFSMELLNVKYIFLLIKAASLVCFVFFLANSRRIENLAFLSVFWAMSAGQSSWLPGFCSGPELCIPERAAGSPPQKSSPNRRLWDSHNVSQASAPGCALSRSAPGSTWRRSLPETKQNCKTSGKGKKRLEKKGNWNQSWRKTVQPDPQHYETPCSAPSQSWSKRKI